MNSIPFTRHEPLVAGERLNGHWRPTLADGVLLSARVRLLVASTVEAVFTLLIEGVAQPEQLRLAAGQLAVDRELNVPVPAGTLVQWRCDSSGGRLAALVATTAHASEVDLPPRQVWYVSGDFSAPVLDYEGAGVFAPTVHAPGRAALSPETDTGPGWLLDGDPVAQFLSGVALAPDWSEYAPASGTASALQFRLGARVLAVLRPDGLHADRLTEGEPLEVGAAGFEFYEEGVLAASLDRLGFRARSLDLL